MLPLEGIYEVSIDGAYIAKKAGVGVGIRDHVEDVITSMAARLYGVMDAGHTKAMSVWQGLWLAKELLMDRTILDLN